MFEHAKWIENAGCPAEWAPIFHKAIELEEVKNTEIAICGLGFYILEVNGKRVSDDLLTPPFTAYDKRVLYQVYDITEYLHVGENKLEVTCGNGWYNQQEPDGWDFQHAVWKSAPQLICQINVEGKCYLVSDTTWETAKSRIVFNSHRLGESYQVAADIQGFHPASIAKGPGGILERQTMPPVKLQGTYEGKEVFPYVYDFGQSITGNVEIKVQGNTGDWATILYSERIRDDGTIDREFVSQHVLSKRFAEDVYFLKGDGEEIWHSEFGFHGFRYVRIDHPITTKIISVTARDMHTDLQDKGGYTCDNENINRLHQACVRALRTNYIHIPMDCPHREKNGWTADAMLSSFQALYNLDMTESYKKWLDDIVDCQRANGQIPCIAPTSLWGYGWGSGVTWDAVLFILPWNIYKFTGDVSVIERYYSAMGRYLSYLETQSDDNTFTIGLGDWCAPREITPCDTRAMLTCYAKHVFDLYAQMSEILGNDENRDYAVRRASEIRSAFQKEFIGKQESCQTYYAALVYFDMVDDKEETARLLAEKVKEDRGHLYAGIFGAYLVPIVLREYGYFELAWEMVCKEEYPGWLYLMNKCHGAMGENWRGGESLDHHMFTTVDAFIQESLSGLDMKHAEAGFKTIHLNPYFPKEMKEFSFWHDLEEGRIKIRWDETSYCIVIPEGICGTLTLFGESYSLKEGENVFPIME
mgnify:CR=1 FL=1